MAGRVKKNTSNKSAGKTSNRKSSPSRQEREDFQPFRDEIIFVLTLMVCILIALSGFGLCGPVGKGINWIIFGAFGLLGWILPYVLFLGICFYISNKNNFIAKIKCICGSVLYFLCSTLVQIISSWSADKIDVIKCASEGAARKQGGGLFGGFMAWLMSSGLGKMGTLVVLIAAILILIIITTEHLIFASLREKGRNMQRNRKARKEQQRKIQYNIDDVVQEEYEIPDENRYMPESSLSDKRFFSLSRLSIFKEKPPVISGKESQETENVQTYETQSKDSWKGWNPSSDTNPKKNTSIQEPLVKDIESNDFDTDKLSKPSVRKVTTSEEPDFIEQPDFIIAKEYRDEPEEELIIDHEPEYILPTEPEEDVVPEKYDTEDDFIHVKPANTYEETFYETDMQQDVTEEEISSDDRDFESQYDGAYDDAYYDNVTDTFQNEDMNVSVEMKKSEPISHITTTSAPKQDKQETTSNNIQTRNSIPTQNTGQTAEEQLKAAQANTEPPKKPYQFPRLDLLTQVKSSGSGMSEQELRATAIKLQSTLESFGVKVKMQDYCCGPSVTRYELQPAMGVKVSRITSLADDIKLSLAAADIRIEAPIPGKAAVGIEVPNKTNSMVTLRSLLESKEFQTARSNISFAVGKDIAGKVIVTDIAKMPHLLIAGATGSGKSVCINTLIMSILYKAHPDDVKLIMVDPKVVELNCYNGIPHLMIPVVTDPKKAAGALNWAVSEMNDRYNKFAEVRARNIEEYHERIKHVDPAKNDTPYQKIPQIVIIVDELADLMMVASNEVDTAICRLAQLARAAGIHLVIATQRPSVNVITGTIKANIPSRIAFAVSSAIDSRTILDGGGAEKLLGKGDMLFFPYGYPKPVRVQGAFVSDQEVSNVVEYLTRQYGEVEYDSEVAEKINSTPVNGNVSAATPGNELDDYFVEAGRFIIEKDKASIGILQRAFKVGFNRAARIMEQLHDAGVVGEEEGTKPRKVLMSMEEFEAYIDEYV